MLKQKSCVSADLTTVIIMLRLLCNGAVFYLAMKEIHCFLFPDKDSPCSTFAIVLSLKEHSPQNQQQPSE